MAASAFAFVTMRPTFNRDFCSGDAAWSDSGLNVCRWRKKRASAMRVAAACLSTCARLPFTHNCRVSCTPGGSGAYQMLASPYN